MGMDLHGHGHGLACTWTWTCMDMDMDWAAPISLCIQFPNPASQPLKQTHSRCPPPKGLLNRRGGMKSPAVGVIWYTFWADVHVRVYMMAVSQCLCAPYEYTYVQCMLLEAVRHTPRYMSSKTAKWKTSYINKNINGVTFKKYFFKTTLRKHLPDLPRKNLKIAVGQKIPLHGVTQG